MACFGFDDNESAASCQQALTFKHVDCQDFLSTSLMQVVLTTLMQIVLTTCGKSANINY